LEGQCKRCQLAHDGKPFQHGMNVISCVKTWKNN